MDKRDILNKYFGYTEFKFPQDYIIDTVLSGADTICLLPTGFGKSLTYQIPALMLDGLTLVISPLIALMEDQVNHLKEKNIAASLIHSDLSIEVQKKIYRDLTKNKIKLLYLSPERLYNALFLKTITNVAVDLIAIDEAHTILWAEGFRDAFAHIGTFIESLKERPKLLALTATATNQTIEKIKYYLKMQNPILITLGMDRPNIFYRVIRTNDKILFLKSFLKKHYLEKGIIYCITRKKVEQLHTLLKQAGFRTTYYHGGLDSQIKLLNSELFVNQLVPIMICTNAYGMGIDIPDIRYVIQFELPASLEDLAQQMGRAARDGGSAEGIVLFSFNDLAIHRFLINSSMLNRKQKKQQKDKLNQVVDYCLSRSCRHQYLAKKFNQQLDSCCFFCDNCAKMR